MKGVVFRAGLTGLLAALMAACAGTPDDPERQAERDERIERYIDAPAEEERTDSRAPEDLEALLQGSGLPDPMELQPEEPRFDLTVDDVPASTFFQGVVEDTPYNVVVHPEVEGRVSMRLADVTVPEIMETAREVYGYEYRRTDTAYLILPARLETQLFHLDYLNVEREGTSGTRVTSGEITANDNGDGDGIIGSRVTTDSVSRLWEDVEESVERMVEGTEDASVVASPDAGTLAVRALPADLRQIEAFVARLQGRLNQQVMLEARIVEVELADEFKAGLEWEAFGTDSGRVLTGSLSAGGDVGVDSENTFGVDLFREGSFSGVLNALDRQGEVQVLSSPQVSTLNNQKAVIKAGTDAFFQTDVNLSYRTFTDEDGARSTVPEVDPDFEPFFSGIALDVTPQIDDEGWITLHIQPSVTEVREVVRELELRDDDVRFNLAQSDVRQSDSIVRARDGEMIVIGGLIEEREETETSRIPFLGRIPLLGGLFTHQREESRKYELVILLRPHIVGEGTWAGPVDQRRDRLQQMGR